MSAAGQVLLEWVWRGQALANARAWFAELPLSQQQPLRRAQLALELADRAYDPIDPLPTGSSLPLAVSLYREAAYWALLAHAGAQATPDLRSLIGGLPGELLESAAGGSAGFLQVKRALVDRSFVETADLPAEHLEQDARVARDFVHALLRRKLEPKARVGRLLLQRATRSLLVLLLLVVIAVSASAAIRRSTRTPDLAQGKPWRASSSQHSCRPQARLCGGARTDIFFHTTEEKNPWLELDLTTPTSFSIVEVTNRSDCCPDRALPLVLEVSNDATSWREVARRLDTFGVWRAKLSSQTARYVRLRVPRYTTLHLEKVTVHAR